MPSAPPNVVPPLPPSTSPSREQSLDLTCLASALSLLLFTILLDVRFLGGATWYNGLALPNAHSDIYVLAATYGAFVSAKKVKIHLYIPLLDESYRLNHMDVLRWGMRTSPANCVLIDTRLLSQFPGIRSTAAI
jgi:hypothetical protein